MMRVRTPTHRYELLPLDQDGEALEQDSKFPQKVPTTYAQNRSTIIMATLLGLLFLVVGVSFA